MYMYTPLQQTIKVPLSLPPSQPNLMPDSPHNPVCLSPIKTYIQGKIRYLPGYQDIMSKEQKEKNQNDFVLRH